MSRMLNNPEHKLSLIKNLKKSFRSRAYPYRVRTLVDGSMPRKNSAQIGGKEKGQ